VTSITDPSIPRGLYHSGVIPRPGKGFTPQIKIQTLQHRYARPIRFPQLILTREESWCPWWT
jgi:hypothetical protein